MDVDKLLDQAMERLNTGDVEEAKVLLRKAAALAPLRTDIRDLLQQCMEMQPASQRRRDPVRGDALRQAPPQAAPRGRSHFWLWMALGAFMLLLLLIGGGAVALYHYWPLIPSLGTGANQGGGQPTPAVTPTPTAVSENLQRAREKALAAAAQGEYEEAIKTLETALEADPQGRETSAKDLAKWHSELGKGEADARRYTAAIAHFDQARKLDGASSEYSFWLGVTYLRKGRTGTGSQKTRDLNAAREALSKAVDLDQNNLDALEQLAKTYIALGDKVKASDCYKTIITRAPDSIQARTARNDLRDMGMR